MPNGVELGVGYVSLTVSAEGITSDIEQQLAGPLVDASDAAGDPAAKAFASGFGRQLAAGLAAAGVGAALTKGVLDGMARDASSDRMAARLGLDPAQQEQLGQVAGSVYAGAYGDSLEEVQGALADLFVLDTSASSDQLQTLTEQALNMTDAFGVGSDDLATFAGQLENLGLTQSIGESFDYITTAAQQLPSNMIGPLQDAVSEYAPYMRDLGFSTEETFALLTQAAGDGGIALDKTGDALKELGIRATDGSSSTAAAFEAIGLDAKSMSDALLAGGDSAKGATDQIIQALLGVEDPSAQAQAAVALFGTPLEDLSVGQIPEFLSSLGEIPGSFDDVAGATEQMGDTLNSNGQVRMEEWKRKAEGMLVAATDLPGPLGEIAAASAVMGGSVLTTAGDLGAFASGFGGLVAPIAKAVTGIGSFVISTGVSMATATASAVAAIATQVASWIALGAQSLIAAAQVAAAWLIAAGPIIIVGALIAGLAYLIYDNWDSIKKWTAEAWSAVSGTVTSIASSIADWVSDKFNAIVGFASAAWASVKQFVTDGITGARDTVVNIGAQIITWHQELPGKILSALGNLGSLLVGAGKDLIQGLIDGISAKATALFDKVASIASAVKDKFAGVLKIFSPSRVFIGFGEDIMAGLQQGLDSGSAQVQAQIAGVGTDISAQGSLLVAHSMSSDSARGGVTVGTIVAADVAGAMRVLREESRVQWAGYAA